tara:strand:+ start:460 stop:579 length:120 start_codon:yes stop_codon:yes gene_type:complete
MNDEVEVEEDTTGKARGGKENMIRNISVTGKEGRQSLKQ